MTSTTHPFDFQPDVVQRLGRVHRGRPVGDAGTRRPAGRHPHLLRGVGPVFGNELCGAPKAAVIREEIEPKLEDAGYHARSAILVFTSPFTRRVEVLLRPADGWGRLWRIEAGGRLPVLESMVPGHVSAFLNAPFAGADEYDWQILVG